MIKYIRNLFFVVAAQALVLQFCANLIISNRFSIQEFTYGECFVFSLVIMIFTHNLNISNILYHISTLNQSISSLSLVHLNANALIIQNLQDINKNLKDVIDMKLDSIKPLDKKTFTPEQIAEKHGVPISHINSQLEIGIKVEMEHTSHKDVAREIALDHLMELPDYYTRLKKVENED